jgi:hypothetical protein
MNEEPLSNFVKYKELVDNTSINSDELMTIINNVIGVISQRDNILIPELNAQSERILGELTAFNDTLTVLKSDIDKTLRTKELSYFNKGCELYKTTKNDPPEYIIERFGVHPLTSSDDARKHLVHKISEHCTWKYPGLIIRPGVDNWIDLLISLDPLYIVDEHLELLDATKSKWNSTYQSRLRYSIIDEDKDVIFKYIPNNQIGFILAMDFFNYKPFDVIKTYITEIYKLLKHGGVLIFTYNNCNFSNSVRNFENVLYSYTPGSLVKSMVKLIGFEIIDEFADRNYNLNWLEIKKPGSSNSMRGGQCIAKINI